MAQKSTYVGGPSSGGTPAAASNQQSFYMGAPTSGARPTAAAPTRQPQQPNNASVYMGSGPTSGGGALGDVSVYMGGPTCKSTAGPLKHSNKNFLFKLAPQQLLVSQPSQEPQLASDNKRLRSEHKQQSSSAALLERQPASDNRNNNNNLGRKRPSAVECPVERQHALAAAAYQQLVSCLVP